MTSDKYETEEEVTQDYRNEKPGSESESEADNSSDENCSPDNDSPDEEEDNEVELSDGSGPSTKKERQPLRRAREHGCDLCDKRYVKKDSLRLHKRSVHNIDPLACLTCYKQFSNRSELNSHIQAVHRYGTSLHQPPMQFKCSHCTMSFKLEHKYKLHLQLHPESRDEALGDTKATYPCKFCDKIYSKITRLDQHMMTHSSTPFQCEMCDTPPFASRNEMRIHAKEVHTLKCAECPKSFDTKEKLDEHILWHTNCIRQCQYCDQSFPLKQLKIHFKNVHAKTFRCAVCHEMFRRRHEMNEHIETHDKFSCPVCQVEFPSMKGLRLHEVIHKPKTGDAAEGEDDVDKPVMFPCSKCDKTFHKQAGLNTHFRNRHHEDGYLCSHCNKRCTSMNGLRSHMHRHQLKLCPICGVTIATSLNMHMRRHLGINPFKCKVEGCGREFPR